MDNKTIERLWEDARSDSSIDLFCLEKLNFELFLDGMMLKLSDKKGAKAEEQYKILQRMKRFQERQTYVNVLSVFQSKALREKERQIIILESEKAEEIERLNKIINELKQ